MAIKFKVEEFNFIDELDEKSRKIYYKIGKYLLDNPPSETDVILSYPLEHEEEGIILAGHLKVVFGLTVSITTKIHPDSILLDKQTLSTWAMYRKLKPTENSLELLGKIISKRV